MKKLKAGIIGCGNIGGGYDTLNSKEILTHAKAFLSHKFTNLVACSDVSQNALDEFVKKWGEVKTFLDYKQMLKEDLDIIAIAVPTKIHFEVLSYVLKNTNIKHIICEKPFVENQKECKVLMKLIENKKPNLLINLMRCFDPSSLKVKKIIKKETLGKVLHFRAAGVKGLYHNGSHTLSLIELFFGKITNLKSFDSVVDENDVYGSFFVETKKANGVFVSLKDSSFSFFEMDIFFENGLIKIKNSGFDIEVYKSIKSDKFNGTSKLEFYKKLPPSLDKYALNTLDFLLKKNTFAKSKKQLNFSLRLLKIRDKLRS